MSVSPSAMATNPQSMILPCPSPWLPVPLQILYAPKRQEKQDMAKYSIEVTETEIRQPDYISSEDEDKAQHYGLKD